VKVVIGSDHNGFDLKAVLVSELKHKRIAYLDVGVFRGEQGDYPDIAENVANRIASGEGDRGILICRTGIGMAIAANKVRGVRAAVCHDLLSAEMSVKSNNVQVLALGASLISESFAKDVINLWLSQTQHLEESKRKLAKLSQIESRTMKD
jgi:ribose 5-phosphate isomerase B